MPEEVVKEIRKADKLSNLQELKMTLNGREITAYKGEMIIEAAARAGVFIPRFCYHPRMKPVGMCRMCLVEVLGPRGPSLQPACYMAVAEGQEVITNSSNVRKAQEGILEFLLVNHPLDCPICDKGGECPLQDQTLANGPGESRFIEEKRHFLKPISLSSLVLLDRERCIQCARCIRFADEIAGEPLIDFMGRGDEIEVGIFSDDHDGLGDHSNGYAFSSYFSGNTVQICPVGALTAAPYRFKSRPWDLEQVESSCTLCALGCRMVVQSSFGTPVRHLGIDLDSLNQSWLCDKGRFSFEAVSFDNQVPNNRVSTPLVRKEGELKEVSWGEALTVAAQGLKKAIDRQGHESVAFLGGSQLTCQDGYAWAKFAKSVIRTDSCDAQLADGIAPEVVLALPRATIDEACSARAVVIMAGDLKEELPILWLRLRSAVLNKGLELIEITPVPTALSDIASVSLFHRPGEVDVFVKELFDSSFNVPGHGTGSDKGSVSNRQTDKAVELSRVAELLGDGDGVVVIVGRQSLAETHDPITRATLYLAAHLDHATFLPALRRSNVNGALEVGLAPGILPGRVGLEEGREFFTRAWGDLPDHKGKDATAVFESLSSGGMEALVLLGADPLSDFPDQHLAKKALSNASFIVAVDSFLTDSSLQADVVLPACITAERSGTFENIEGRLFSLARIPTPKGQSWTDFEIAASLASCMGKELGFHSYEQIDEEMRRVMPSWSSLELTSTADSLLDPVATPGIGSVAEQGFSEQGFSEQGFSEQGFSMVYPNKAGGADVTGNLPKTLSLGLPHPIDPMPAPDNYTLRLVVTRSLYDMGTLMRSCPSISNLVPECVLRVNPKHLERLGVSNGDTVHLRSSQGELKIKAYGDASVPQGIAALKFNLPTSRGTNLVASAIIDAHSTVTEVYLEALER
ncbi:MAG: NADH-quinone oxidoreductase subunit NuoG [Actinobacteria bacterium]|nr:NADH-quinone oxidoreductase subunit NuoG [Actinomycetota bacterium]MCL6105183.1 NADH-quinone oxidoreductase subunit NuoG [Actinomycetota bacterium]